MKFAWYIVFAAAALLCGCSGVSPHFYPLAGNAQFAGAPRSAESVEIFITKKPEYKYRELGMITYEIPASYSNEPEVYEAMRRKAAEIGADAIIIMDSQSSVENMPRLTLDYYGFPYEVSEARSYIKYRAMAISKSGK